MVIAAYYGGPAKQAYFHGCSDGGREALMEAQRFPGDYDAIIAGAPASPWTRLMSAFMWNDRTLAAAPIPNAKLPLLQNAALAQCDKLDGVADGVMEDPRLCRFDPGVLECKAGDADDCLTASQLAAARAIYRGPITRAGKPLFPGFPAGGEAIPNGWDMWISGPNAQHGRFATEFFRWMVFADAAWDPKSFAIERDLKIAQTRQGGDLDADNPDLSAFKARGGKLILYHGWGDAAIPPQNTIDYYSAVRAKTAGADDFVRLFMAPGMSHCLMGPGPNSFDVLGAIDAWKTTGVAPETLTATKFDNDLLGYLGFPAKPVRTRPLCAYPKTARWNGVGSTDEAGSFACVAPK
jgi:feruloyl esterase